MSIRTKFFLALVAFSFGPLLVGTLVARTNILGLRDTLATLTHDQLTAMSDTTRMQLVDKQAALLDRNAARTAIEVIAAVRRLEHADRHGTGDLAPPERYYTDDEFDDPRDPPPGLRRVDGIERVLPDGSRSPVLASDETPVYVIPEGSSRHGLADEFALLWSLAAYFIESDTTPEGAFATRSRFAALADSGLHVSWPGRGGYPARYDPTRRAWFQQAATTLTPDRVIWTQPIIDAPTGQVRITCAAPAFRDNGELIGVVGTDLLLTDIIREISLPETIRGVSRSMIVRPELSESLGPGVRIWADASYDEQSGTNWRSPVELERFGDGAGEDGGRTLGERLSEALLGTDEGSIELDYEGKPWIWTFRRLSDSELYVLVGLSRAAAESAVENVIGRVTTAIDRTRTQNFVVAAGVLTLVAVVGLFGSRSITRPIRSLAATAQRIAGGDLDATADVHTSDEIGTLATTFNEMVPKLQDRLRVLESLALASEVQQHLLPKQPPTIEGLDIASRSVYCDETGGDYHDFYSLGGSANRHALVVGDVTGHGIASALLMTTARAMLRITATESDGPADALTRVNTHLARDSQSGHFMTLYYLVLDAAERACTWVSAGHDAAIVYAVRDNAFRELVGTDIPLGIDGSWAFHEHQAELPEDSVIVIGTDGIWEARNPAGDMFGKDRLRGVIAEHAGSPADTIAQRVLDAVTAFRGGAHQTDDITLVVIKVLGTG